MKIKNIIVVLSIIICNSVVYSQIYDDATTLTLREQSTIWLDSTLLFKIDSVLQKIKSEIDTLKNIHAFPASKELLIETTAEWSQKWKEGKLQTGEFFIDSLNTVYNLAEVKLFSLSRFGLRYSQPLKISLLVPLFMQNPDVKYASAHGGGMDGDDIELINKDSIWLFLFSDGEGDCENGCIFRYYWYVTVKPGEPGFDVKLVEERERNFRTPFICRWNIPIRYAMTMFENTKAIIDSIRYSQSWWVRRHAIEGVGYFFERNSPWVGEDNNEHWFILKSDLYSAKDELISVLSEARNDPDRDVRASAEKVLKKLLLTGIENEPGKVSSFYLFQNYPNPFNPVTKIKYAIGSQQYATLKIYDILGNEIVTLVNEEKPAGENEVEFNGAGLASGIYFYTLRSGSYTKTKKAILLK